MRIIDGTKIRDDSIYVTLKYCCLYKDSGLTRILNLIIALWAINVVFQVDGLNLNTITVSF